MTTSAIKKDKLADFIDGIIRSGKIVVAPKLKSDKTYFARVNSFAEINLDYIQTALSAKSVLFPKIEELLQYRKINGETVVESLSPKEDQVVVFGIRPCDAASIPYMADFFLRENPDHHFRQRLNNTTFITLSCSKSDDFCFCTSVGIGPGSVLGSDLQLTEMDGEYYCEVLSDKAKALLSEFKPLFSDLPLKSKEPYLADVPKKFDIDSLSSTISVNFDSPFWVGQSLACLSCGTCAYACPSCTCFDIQDEGNIEDGKRFRCWDSCALGLFTLHASGHNPRSVQSQRWRQRLMHKFDYSLQNLQAVSCFGCGRCARLCPAQMNIAGQALALTEVKNG